MLSNLISSASSFYTKIPIKYMVVVDCYELATLETKVKSSSPAHNVMEQVAEGTDGKDTFQRSYMAGRCISVAEVKPGELKLHVQVDKRFSKTEMGPIRMLLIIVIIVIFGVRNLGKHFIKRRDLFPNLRLGLSYLKAHFSNTKRSQEQKKKTKAQKTDSQLSLSQRLPATFMAGISEEASIFLEVFSASFGKNKNSRFSPVCILLETVGTDVVNGDGGTWMDELLFKSSKN
ncbi:hypothetical protein E2320_000492, partial [Naja naja]